MVTGATGALGSALVRQLEGEDVRVLVRDGDAFLDLMGDIDVDVWTGDLTSQEDIDQVIDDVDTVLHCPNVRYVDWGDLIGHTRRLIKAAEEEEKDVDIVYPGTIHVYGDAGPGPLTEDTPHEPKTRKGDIRLNIERQLREANSRGECRTTVARFPDLYGPGVLNTPAEWVFRPALEGKQVSWPGDLDAKREFVYVDDAARAMLELARSERSWGKAWHVPGPSTITARQFITHAFTASGKEPDMRAVGRGSWNLKGKLSKAKKQDMEIFYLYENPPLLDGTRWKDAFGPLEHRSYQSGIKAAVEWWRRRLASD